MSAMKVEKSGRNSCTGNSRLIFIRYVFVKDRLDQGEFRLKYCPTRIMIAHYHYKEHFSSNLEQSSWDGNTLIQYLHPEIRSVLRNKYFWMEQQTLQAPLKIVFGWERRISYTSAILHAISHKKNNKNNNSEISIIFLLIQQLN